MSPGDVYYAPSGQQMLITEITDKYIMVCAKLPGGLKIATAFRHGKFPKSFLRWDEWLGTTQGEGDR